MTEGHSDELTEPTDGQPGQPAFADRAVVVSCARAGRRLISLWMLDHHHHHHRHRHRHHHRRRRRHDDPVESEMESAAAHPARPPRLGKPTRSGSQGLRRARGRCSRRRPPPRTAQLPQSPPQPAPPLPHRHHRRRRHHHRWLNPPAAAQPVAAKNGQGSHRANRSSRLRRLSETGAF